MGVLSIGKGKDSEECEYPCMLFLQRFCHRRGALFIVLIDSPP